MRSEDETVFTDELVLSMYFSGYVLLKLRALKAYKTQR